MDWFIDWFIDWLVDCYVCSGPAYDVVPLEVGEEGTGQLTRGHGATRTKETAPDIKNNKLQNIHKLR